MIETSSSAFNDFKDHRDTVSEQIYGIYYRKFYGRYEAIPDEKIEEIADLYKETLKIPQGCQVSKEIKIVGKGFPSLQGKARGNLIIITQCDIPKSLNSETKQSLSDFAEKLGNQSTNSEGGISGFFKKFLG